MESTRKVLAYCYSNTQNVGSDKIIHHVYDVTDNQLKETVRSALFEKNYDCCLLIHNDKCCFIEKNSDEPSGRSFQYIDHHPYMYMIQ